MAWNGFVSAPVSLDEFASAKKVLTKIVENIIASPSEQKFKRLRLTNPVLARALFPQARTLLHRIGFEQREGSEWLEIDHGSVPALPEWLALLSTARLQHSVPDSLGSATTHLDHMIPEHSVMFSGFCGTWDILRSRAVSRQWRFEAQAALLQVQLLDLTSLLPELCFDGWFELTTQFTSGDPIAEFQKDLIGSPLTCYAGGSMRLKRPVITDITVADVNAFRRLNPWEMLKVTPYGLRARPTEPSLEWWAKLNALVTTSELCGRQWDWSERGTLKNSLLYVRHIVYVLARGATRITITMRAVWDSSAP